MIELILEPHGKELSHIAFSVRDLFVQEGVIPEKRAQVLKRMDKRYTIIDKPHPQLVTTLIYAEVEEVGDVYRIAFSEDIERKKIYRVYESLLQ